MPERKEGLLCCEHFYYKIFGIFQSVLRSRIMLMRLQLKISMRLRLLPYDVVSQLFSIAQKLIYGLGLVIFLIFHNKKFQFEVTGISREYVKLLHFLIIY
jgi:hypothetical protein